jgi:carboxylesterase
MEKMFLNKEFVFKGDNGAAVLLLHGATSGASQMRPLAVYLNMFGYTVYGVNLAGHGTLKESLAQTSWEEIVDSADKKLKDIQPHFDKVFVGGFSLGGLTALYLAARHPELAGAVMLAAPYLPVEASFYTTKYETEFAHKPLDNKSGLYKMYHNHYEYVPVSFFAQIAAMRNHFVDSKMIANVTCPVLFIQPPNDGSVNPNSAQMMFELVGSKDKELMMLQGGGHVFLLSEYRYEPYEKFAQFLNRLL